MKKKSQIKGNTIKKILGEQIEFKNLYWEFSAAFYFLNHPCVSPFTNLMILLDIPH